MRAIWALLSLFLFAGSAEAAPRILAGEPVRENFQSTVSLVMKKEPFSHRGHICGGTLVRPRWVLTAAHCVSRSSWRQIDVVAGRLDLSGRGGQRIAVLDVRIHPRYRSNARNAHYDFALLRLQRPARVRPIAALRSGRPRVGAKLWTAGWGQNEWEEQPAQLHSVRVQSFPQRICRARYGPSESFFCAGRRGGVYDSCYGDSGGPLLSRHKNREVLWGVVSFGRGCGEAGWPGAYASVAVARRWMLQEMRQSSPKRHVRVGRQRFPRYPFYGLGPLRVFEIGNLGQTEIWSPGPEGPFDLITLRLIPSRAWPVQSVTVTLSRDVCGEEGCYKAGHSWQMNRIPLIGHHFLYFYLQARCTDLEARVRLETGRLFTYRANTCQPANNW